MDIFLCLFHHMTSIHHTYREIANQVHCEQLILNGDHCNDGVKAYKVDSYHVLRNYIKEFNYLPSLGGTAKNRWRQDRAFI